MSNAMNAIKYVSDDALCSGMKLNHSEEISSKIP